MKNDNGMASVFRFYGCIAYWDVESLGHLKCRPDINMHTASNHISLIYCIATSLAIVQSEYIKSMVHFVKVSC